MFIGEAPGQDEDIQGLPFVGRAGQLLTKIIEAMGLKRDEVYIANILKCRPPNNRIPLPDEIAACEDIVKRQVAIINPKVICTLGKFASQTLLKTQAPISVLRGHFQEYNGIPVMPTFHPAYLLRNPADKKLVWSDMKKVMKELGLNESRTTNH
jgi:DNA polymerase